MAGRSLPSPRTLFATIALGDAAGAARANARILLTQNNFILKYLNEIVYCTLVQRANARAAPAASPLAIAAINVRGDGRARSNFSNV